MDVGLTFGQSQRFTFQKKSNFMFEDEFEQTDFAVETGTSKLVRIDCSHKMCRGWLFGQSQPVDFFEWKVQIECRTIIWQNECHHDVWDVDFGRNRH